MAFVAAEQTTESGEPQLMCLSKRPFTKETIEAFAARSLALPLQRVSDGLTRFTAVQDMGIRHERHVTGGGAASASHSSFRAINTLLGNLKTSLSGTCHAFGFTKYADRHLAQVQYLFNRRFGLSAILRRLAIAACRTGRCPLHSIRATAFPWCSGGRFPEDVARPSDHAPRPGMEVHHAHPSLGDRVQESRCSKASPGRPQACE